MLYKYEMNKKKWTMGLIFSVAVCIGMIIFVIFKPEFILLLLLTIVLFGYNYLRVFKGRNNTVEIHEDYLITKIAGKVSKIKWTEIEGIAVHGKGSRFNKAMNIFRKNGMLELECVALISTEYTDWKDMWRNIIAQYEKKNPENCSVDVKFTKILEK